ncbi:MAG: methoxymalonyl-ACP biosynthesis protein FkbH [Rhodospirillaceae bacterium]|jgi:FkbH-like protein|nr:methoxymalonyl-ACP biosynthesis protein FkbH [Rhodospirillaceae bacterium]|tara:strand:- start:3339 stop:5267 length:1929 start_codon:yes stop_codon:yes gene_type:complete
MTSLPDLYWLPDLPDYSEKVSALSVPDPQEQINVLARLAQHRLDFLRTTQLDRRLADALENTGAPPEGFTPFRLAVLRSSTMEHLLPAIRIAGLRRGLLIECYLCPYGQYQQEVLAPDSDFHAFRPEAVLFAVDAHEALPRVEVGASSADIEEATEKQVDEWRALWRHVRDDLDAVPIHQLMANDMPDLFGGFDSMVPGAPANLLGYLNDSVRRAAREEGALVLDVERMAARVGLNAWSDPVRWFHGKQDIAPQCGPLYGELVSRQLAALRGLSRKCLVVDLDGTLWGGIAGDDGIEGLVLGPGSAEGEAFRAFQVHLRRLMDRGIILAVCSKNDPDVAEDIFKNHPEMVLKPDDMAVFVANWEDKPANLQRVAETLNIGLEALVFFDDNPAERHLVRETLPGVAVPEAPKDPAFYVRCLSDAGYFEAIDFTPDDKARGDQYAANLRRTKTRTVATDINSFLGDLSQEMTVGPFDPPNLPRITQLVNKTNQFNLTTRRYSQVNLEKFAQSPNVLTLWARLKDRFGDNGLISVVVARPVDDDAEDVLFIDTWLMSCRVFGRRVEEAVLNMLVDEAQRRGVKRLIGEYLPTDRNHIVADLYERLGFHVLDSGREDGSTKWELLLENFQATESPVTIINTAANGH